MKNKLAAIEGILFSMGTSVTRRQLMEALEIDNEQFDELIKLLQTEYDKEERGIRLLELDDAYQLCTKTEYYGSLIRIVNHPKKPRLTDVMLETLSIIASLFFINSLLQCPYENIIFDIFLLNVNLSCLHQFKNRQKCDDHCFFCLLFV